MPGMGAGMQGMGMGGMMPGGGGMGGMMPGQGMGMMPGGGMMGQMGQMGMMGQPGQFWRQGMVSWQAWDIRDETEVLFRSRKITNCPRLDIALIHLGVHGSW